MRIVPVTLAAAALAAGAAAPAEAAPPNFTTGHGCAAPCITSALVLPTPSAAGVRVFTSTPARITIVIRKRAVSDAGGGDLAAPPAGSAASAPGQTKLAAYFSKLLPDTRYEITVRATDAQNRTDERSSTFKTPKPQTNGLGGPGSFSGGEIGCGGACIAASAIDPGLTAAKVGIVTKVPARLTITADTTPPTETALGPFHQDPDAKVHTTDLRKAWSGMLEGLQPGRRYHTIVRATDANGRTAYGRGTFDTKQRHVIVRFTSIKVVDDGDKGKRDRGELRFFAKVGSTWRFFRGEEKIDAGATVSWSRNASLGLIGTGRFLTLAVQGTERDYKGCWGTTFDASGEGGLNAVRTADSGSRRSYCNQWTWRTGRMTADLDQMVGGPPLPPGFGASGTQRFTLDAMEGRLRFRASVAVEVWTE